MKYITHNDMDISANDTSFQGEVDADFNLLCTLFGRPFSGDEYKVDAEWVIEFEDGTVASIYNWKNGFNYLGAQGTPSDQIRSWHVGGHDQRSVELIKAMLEERYRITTIQGHNPYLLEG